MESTLNQERERISRVASRADGAAETANQALAKAELADSRMTRLWVNRNKREKVETVVLIFGFNK